MRLQLPKRGNVTFSDFSGKFSLCPEGWKGVKNVFFPSVPKILNDHSLDLLEILHEVTTNQGRKCNNLRFLRKILGCSCSKEPLNDAWGTLLCTVADWGQNVFFSFFFSPSTIKSRRAHASCCLHTTTCFPFILITCFNNRDRFLCIFLFRYISSFLFYLSNLIII